ncbi:MAG: PxKF domain-containing protein [Thermomicrobiales bacterium]|nr:PxKF domain-containing protein [Thermomicrobiales bacterium]
MCDSGAYDTNSGPAFTPPIITPLLNPALPSGANGWYTGDVTLNWIVTEPDVPETLAMTGCESQSVLTDQVKVDYSCQASSADGDTGPVVVTIGRDTTPPVVAVTGVTDGATYALGAVPTAGCSTTDATSGVALQARLLTDGGPLGEVTATCVTGVDYAGNIAWASATYTVKESGTSSPEIEYTLDPATPTGSNGWYVGDVSLHWTIPDVDLPDSVVLTGCEDQTITADQVKTTYTCAATFEGGAAGPVSVEIGRDATPPAVTITGVTNGATYPLLEVPSAGCETADATSGVATEATVSTQGGPFGVITVRCSGATDHAGNSGSAEMTYTVVDGTPPTVSYSLDPGSPTGSNGWYTEDVTLTWIVTETDTPDTLTQVGCANQAITADQSKTTYSCQATSDGGSSSVVNVVIGRDTVPPVVTVTGATDGATYTVSSVPTVACTTTDTTSGVLSEATMTHSGGPLGMITVTCADGQDDAGNLSSATISYFVTDDTPPVITSTINPETATGANGWYVDDVTLSWTVTETDSPESLVLSGCADQEITSDQLKMTYTCAATSDGGVAGPVSIEIGRDAAPPVVTVTGVADGATYPSDAVPVAGCATSDATSGVATEATLVITGGLIGQVTATCSGALDLAGNTNTTSVTYTVTDGTPPTISYHLSPETPDGSNEWYTSDVTLTWSVSDLESPTSIVLDGCEDQTIVADQAETTYSCGATSDGGVATLIVVEIGRDSTPPTVTITGVNSGATYTSDAVPSAGCTTSDATSGVAHEASLSTSGGPVGQVTITCSGAQDVAGNIGSATLTFTVLAADTTAPEVSFTLNPVAPDGSESWYVSDVTLGWIIIEPESPDTLSLEGCTDLVVSADQQKTSYSCIATSAGGSSQHVSAVIGRDATPPTVTVTGVEDGATYTYSAVPAAGCTTTDALSGVAADATLSLIGGPVGTVRATCAGAADHAGNSGSAEVTYNVVDDTPPTINYSLNPETPKGSNGWYTSDVLLHWTISESQSPDSVIITGCEDRTISLDQVKTTYSCSATSDGGTAAQVDVVVGRDTSLPTVVVTGVEDGATYVYGAVPTVGCSTTDATSGVAVDATPTSVGGPVGEITVICDGAVDHAGNPGSATATITVLYDWQGFASISNGPRGPRKVLAGQAMSIVFTIRGNVGLDAVTSITTIACNAGPTVQPVPAQPAGNRGELQTTANGQYLFQWQTSRAWAGSCQILQVNLTDGTTHEMRVEFQR